MIAHLSACPRYFVRAALLAGLFTAASALATPKVATPSFSPAGGAYASAQSVTLTSGTSGASIVYTTDGSIPTESGGAITHGTLYTGAIPVASTTTLTAIAFENGQTDSAVSIAGYTLETTLTLNVLYNFSAANNGGINPAVGLVQGSDGNFYGTTQYGGDLNDGIVFKLSPVGGIWSLTTLHSFNGLDGAHPLGALVQGANGNFYGTTSDGVNGVYGTVFEITPAGALTVLVSFNGGNDAYPLAGLVLGNDGNFYGTTHGAGGTIYGTVFRMTPAGFLTTLVIFHDDLNGVAPDSCLVQAGDGNFYGTTSFGGSGGYGTVFEMTPSGALTTLDSFDGTFGGAGFDATPVQGNDGKFYGIIQNWPDGHNATVTQMTSGGILTTWANLNSTSDGSEYDGPLVLGRDGNFYGTTYSGGSSNDGIVFQMTPAGGLAILYNFSGADGATPYAGLVQGRDGNFYGTTFAGGSSGGGTIFQLIVPVGSTLAPAPPPPHPAAGSGGGAPSYWFLGFLAFAGILRWKLRQTKAI